MHSIYPRPTKVCETCKKTYEKPIRLGISHWLRRRFCSKECQYKNWIGRKNENSYAWKEKIGVYGVHAWLYRNYGKANKCEICGLDKIPIKKKRYFDWALKKGFNYEKKRENFMMLCRACHARYDDKLKYLELGRGDKRDYYKNKRGGD